MQIEVKYIQVKYVDDYRNKHICFVQTQKEIDWLIDRFGQVIVRFDNNQNF